MLNLDAAREELSKKAIEEIQEDTAWKWASRAVVAFQLAVELKGSHKASVKFVEACEYYGEAREHASQVGHWLVKEIQDAVSRDYLFANVALSLSEEKKDV